MLLLFIFLIIMLQNAVAQNCTSLIDTGYIARRQHWAHYPLINPYSKTPQTFTQRDTTYASGHDSLPKSIWVARMHGNLYLLARNMHDNTCAMTFYTPMYFGKLRFAFADETVYECETALLQPVVSFAVLLDGKAKGWYPSDFAKLKGKRKKLAIDQVFVRKLKTQLISTIQYEQAYLEYPAENAVLGYLPPVISHFTEAEARKLQLALQCLVKDNT